MSEEEVESAADGDYEKCTVRCSKIIENKPGGETVRCSNKCSKTNTPSHAAYGTHYCSDHA